MPRTPRPRDGGFSLVEVMVVVSLLGVVSTIATNGMIDSMRVQRGQVERVTQHNEVKVAMERVTRDLRGANPISVAQPNKLQLVITRGTTERTATYTLSTVGTNTRLLLSDSTRTLPSGAPAVTTRVVLDQLSMSGQPVFTYTNGSNAAPGVLASPPVGCDALQACFDPTDIERVRLHLETTLTGTARTIGLESVVNVRNEES